MNETDMSQITAVGCAALNEDQMHMEYLLTAQIKSVFFSPYILRRSFFFFITLAFNKRSDFMPTRRTAQSGKCLDQVDEI